jgi:uncharacterized membrane protein YdjX (TVP38/TMEM64 family)
MKISNIYNWLVLIWFTFMPLVFSGIMGFYLFKYQLFFENLSFFSWFLVAVLLTFSSALAFTPPTYLAIVYGYFLGFYGVFYVFLINVLAILLVYFWYKLYQPKGLARIFDRFPKAALVLLKLKKEEFKIIFFAKLSPIIPFAITNLVFAFSGAKLKNIALAGFLGMIPRTLLAVYTGSQANEISKAINDSSGDWYAKLIILSLVILSVSGLIWSVNKAFNQSKNIDIYKGDLF